MSGIHPGLVQKAITMEATADTATDSLGRQWPCERCPDCDGVIVPVGVEGRLHHLMLEHGWRMDGRRFSNRNELLEVMS
jgi:hypothetical protein